MAEQCPYRDIFAEKGWASVQEEFSTDAPEPFRVLYANYSYEDYSGDADVFWQNADGTFGYVSGGHCSCYGLEGQWAPEAYTREQITGQIERANYGFFHDHKDLIEGALATT